MNLVIMLLRVHVAFCLVIQVHIIYIFSARRGKQNHAPLHIRVPFSGPGY